ncbi:MAG TPA: glycoside hydrolase family 19 protein, partial [Bacteroidia bacterium]|nr:glycoside hydrolase family 19 protein [Bacteroidia bacterium]
VQEKFGANTPLRMSHFLAQLAHESGGFKKPVTIENLKYSAQRMSEVWPGRYAINPKLKPFAPNALANSLANNDVALGNNAYANRNGNGDEASGDGFKFRGRGYIQLTGKGNYAAFTKFIGEDCVANPDLIATKYPLASAAFFFANNKLWAICDKGADDATVTAVTKKVNNGDTGLPERKEYFYKFFNALNIPVPA